MKMKLDLKIDNNNIDGSFERIAKELLNNHSIKTKAGKYRIREIEFYYLSDNHPDVYTHKNLLQLQNSTLYFHRFKNPEKYLNLKMKGIDITIGDNVNNYGGILLRTLEDLATNEIIVGPGKITNRIISDNLGVDFISELSNRAYDLYDNKYCTLTKDKVEELDIFKKRRVGLSQKKKDENKTFLTAKLNFFTYPEIVKI